jgi:hypothetical protein
MIFLCLLRRDHLLHVLFASLSELERFPHPVQLSYAIVVITRVVVVSQTVLVLRRFHQNQNVNVYHRILFFFLELGLFEVSCGLSRRINHGGVRVCHIIPFYLFS